MKRKLTNDELADILSRNPNDAIEFCELAARLCGIELTIKQATKLLRPPMYFPEVQRFAVVSTGHISLEDSKILARAGDRGITDLNPCPVVYPYEYGWFVHVPEPGDLKDNLETAEAAGLSEAYRKLIRECCKQGFHFLRLDEDGPEIEGAELFEW